MTCLRLVDLVLSDLMEDLTVQIVCNRATLSNAVSLVTGVVQPRSPKAILQNIKLDVTESRCSLLATDLEVGIRYDVLGVTVKECGSIILPTQHFGQIVRTMLDEELTIHSDDDHVYVQGSRAEFKLTSEDPDLFPDVPDFAMTHYFEVESNALARAIRRTVFATDIESTRYALGGVLFELQDSSLILVGSDGRRLAHQVLPVEIVHKPSVSQSQSVVPVKALKLLERTLHESAGTTQFAFQGNATILLRTDHAVIYSRLLEGRFPRYQDVFPAHVEHRIPLEPASFLKAVEQAAILTSDESRGVDFAFGSGNLCLTSMAPDHGRSEVNLPIAHQGPHVSITFDPRYLADALRALSDVSSLSAELTDSKNAALLRTDDGYTYVVMPLTRDR